MVSELIFEVDGKEIHRVNVNVTPIINVRLTNTTIGERPFKIEVIYDWNKSMQAKDHNNVKGVILK
jgi:hypothetical protein